MEAKEMLEKALDILTEKNEAKGDKWSDARRLAYVAMYGMLSNGVSKEKAKTVLEVAEEWD